jgi:ABC-type glycerol-3-phosphate transport system permease component
MFKEFKRLSSADKGFELFAFLWLGFAGLIVTIPLIYVVACSFSDTLAILQGRVFLWPVDFNLKSYRAVFDYSLLRSGFVNSVFYAAGSTVVSVSLIFLAGYPMSRKDLPGRKIILFFFIITMYFSGGLIPSYILMRNLGLVGSRWALIVGAGFGCYSMIVVKSYFQSSLPADLLDAARIDGCGEIRFFLTIALPLAVPIIAVMTLNSVVGSWNGYFSGILYLTKAKDFSFQMVLRDILFVATMPPEMKAAMDPEAVENAQDLLQQLRYSVLVVGAVPMMILYPFIQKYFIKGIMLGSLKE